MSDFDREAERERLREKYEHDQEKRQSTQRMSELLLKGATMTNRHCEECGDPIFRYEGTEFCPTCQHDGTVEESDATPEDDAADPTAGHPEGDGAAGATPEAGTAAGAAAEATTEGGTTDRADATSEPSRVDAAASPAAETAEDEPTATAAAEASGRRRTGDDATAAAGDAGSEHPRGASRPVRATDDEASTGGEEGDERSAARASLSRTLVRFARAAEGADDPRRARDLLAAAREAAEALAALDRR